MNTSIFSHKSIFAKVAGIVLIVSLLAGVVLFSRGIVAADSGFARSAVSGLTPLVTETGHISLSIDGDGNSSKAHTVQVDKPAGATVRKAYLTASTNWRTTLGNTDVKLDNQNVSWDQHTPILANGVWGENYWADVTSIVKSKIDGAPAGLIDFALNETKDHVDGEVLIVIFDDPNQTSDNTVILFFGALNPNGDSFNITPASPLDPTDPSLVVDLSIGLTYGFQSTTVQNQVSLINVNGQRMTSSAGGREDGVGRALLTVGGIGDSNALPADPDSPP